MPRLHPHLQSALSVLSIACAVLAGPIALLVVSTTSCAHLSASDRAALQKIAVRGAVALADGACVLIRAQTDDPIAEGICVGEEELAPLVPKLFEARAKKAALRKLASDAGANLDASMNLPKKESP